MSRPHAHIRYLIILAATLTLASCEKQRPQEKLLEAERFTQIYVALLEEGIKHKNLSPDSARVFDAEAILSTFGATQEEFRATVRFYNQDLGRWKEFFSAVLKQSELKQEK
jgi:hypothetical protein